MKTILQTIGDKDVIILCDTLKEYTDIENKNNDTVYLIKKQEG